MKSCPQYQEWFDYALGEVSFRRAEELAEHQRKCPACAAQADRIKAQQQLVHSQLDRLTPEEAPYRLWKAPASSRLHSLPGRLALAATAACVVLALAAVQKLPLSCGDQRPAADAFAQYQPEAVNDALEDWNEGRMTITIVREGASEARVIHTGLSSEDISQETIPLPNRGL